MSFPDLCRAPLSLLLLLLLAATPVYPALEHVSEAAQHSQEATSLIMEEELQQVMRDMLPEDNILPLPGLPPIIISENSVSITLSLADIYLQGLNNWDLEKHAFTGTTKRARATLLFYKVSLFVGTYSSSGHILNLPFNGEGPMSLHLHDLSLGLSFEWALKDRKTICATYNTSAYEFDLRRMETSFENLNQNEGADLGQLVEIVVPSFGQDIAKKLQTIVSTDYYQFFDSTIVGLINTHTNCITSSREDILKTDELMTVMNDIIKDLLP